VETTIPQDAEAGSSSELAVPDGEGATDGGTEASRMEEERRAQLVSLAAERHLAETRVTRGGYTEFARAPLPSIHRKEASLIGQEVWLTGTCDPLCKNETTPIEDRRSGRRSSVAPEASRPDEVHVV
jgi:hypothetical protein